MTSAEKILKALLAVDQAIDVVDEILEGEFDDIPSEAFDAVAKITSEWWEAIEGLHTVWHDKFEIPMSIEYCSEHPDNKIGLAEWYDPPR